MTIRVVLGDDNVLVREGVRALLETEADIEVVGVAEDAPSLITRADEVAHDVVVTDIKMPPNFQLEGIECAHQIRAEHPNTGVVVLSAHDDEAYALALLGGGERGLAYLLKDRLGDLEDLIRALREVARGGSVIDPLVVEALVARRTRSAHSPLAALTSRELDVLREMAQGKTNAGVEQALNLSASTVEKHVNSIFGKLGLADEPVHRRVAAVLAFLRERPHSDTVT